MVYTRQTKYLISDAIVLTLNGHKGNVKQTGQNKTFNEINDEPSKDKVTCSFHSQCLSTAGK